MPDLKFWIYYQGGPVKVTLKEGQRLDLVEGGPHEEGYHYDYYSYEHHGNHVSMTHELDARDCDGPMYGTTRCVCYDLEGLKRCRVYKDDQGTEMIEDRVEWRKVRSRY